MDTERRDMTRPIKQIGDEIRELTDDELIEFERDAAQPNPLIQETPNP